MTNERLAEIERYFKIFKLTKQLTADINELIDTVREYQRKEKICRETHIPMNENGWGQSM